MHQSDRAALVGVRWRVGVGRDLVLLSAMRPLLFLLWKGGTCCLVLAAMTNERSGGDYMGVKILMMICVFMCANDICPHPSSIPTAHRRNTNHGSNCAHIIQHISCISHTVSQWHAHIRHRKHPLTAMLIISMWAYVSRLCTRFCCGHGLRCAQHFGSY